jgi:hypothetical protein
MPKGVMVVMTQPVPGKEDEYNDWYSNVHIPELLKIPGIAAAQRFEAVPALSGQLPAQKYMALYEFDTDVDEALKAMREARSAPGAAPASPALDTSSAVMYAYRAIGERAEG